MDGQKFFIPLLKHLDAGIIQWNWKEDILNRKITFHSA